jgi:uncharacterized protein (TIGR02569 family)
VLDAWEANDLIPIDGGQGTAFRAGALVLKPVDVDNIWLLDFLAELRPPDDLRVVRPVQTPGGRLVVDGWSAWAWLEGQPDGSRWRDALDVSTSLHALLVDVPDPRMRRSDPWAIADRWVWGDASMTVPDVARSLVNRIRDAQVEVTEPSQLIHADLCGNVLYHPDRPPAVIDVSPLWRPKRYADAIIVLDAVSWWSAEGSAVAALGDDVGVQMLLRAALFRIGAAALIFDGHPERLAVEADHYERALGPVL